MVKRQLVFLVVYSLCISLVCAQDKTLVLTGDTVIPSSPLVWFFDNVQVRENGVIQLQSKDTSLTGTIDLLLDFEQESLLDIAKKWKVQKDGVLQLVTKEKKFGNHSLYVKAPDGKINLVPAASTIFTPNTVLPSFTLDFWIKPQLAANGEIVFLWKGSRQNGTNWYTQQISCIILQNRLRINFINVFFNDSKEQTITLSAVTPVVPDVWAHYYVTYNAVTGLLQLIKDDRPEAVVYVTATGKENGKLLAGLMGKTINFDLAPNYTGFLDNFRISEGTIEQAESKPYSFDGGTALSPLIDFGAKDSLLKRVLPHIVGDTRLVVINYRLSNSPTKIQDSDWKVLKSDGIVAEKGRYLQLKYELFPDPSGTIAPVIKQVTIEYEQNQLPLPPKNITVVPGNEKITIYWNPSNEPDVKGYVIYYGKDPGKYFGNDAREGISPIIIYGAQITSFTLTGLQNGSLYFICIASFDDEAAIQIGEFSEEVNARPMRVVP